MPAVHSPVNDRKSERGVLERAFTVLEVLSGADRGLGLSELAREAGLAKTTAHRIADHLVAVGAVERIDHRYFMGSLTARLGRSWQPDPVLGRAAADPVRALIGSADAVGVYVLYSGQGRLVTAAARGDRCWLLPPDLNAVYTPLAAAWYSLMVSGDVWGPRAQLSASQWRQIVRSVRDRGFVISDHSDGAVGMSCVAAPLRSTDGHLPATITGLVLAPQPPPGLTDLVRSAADRIDHCLRHFPPGNGAGTRIPRDSSVDNRTDR
ncbi:helix-turn-helix domain-containing protein [Nocardia sp. NPDC023852]|uniref:helix-turn-helix domain-containing protein n=1 Tax=Nocardia sp. NPDC023852 TaxID=3154697 RepID=UPI0033E8B0BE